MSFQHRLSRNALIQVARDLTRSLSSDQRYVRLVEATRQVVESDAAALFRLRPDGVLYPLAVRGLSAETLGRRFDPQEQPRLKAILQAREPIVFDRDDPRPDPFDGLIDRPDVDRFDVHSCMGCALFDGEEAIGVLTMDAIEPGRFDDVDLDTVAAFASLAVSAVRTAELIEALERLAEERGQIAQSLVMDQLRAHGGGFLGRSAAAIAVREEVELVASSDLTVLITGETGTGKELVARSLHDRSRRRQRPLVYVNCAALPESIAESELFGHERGAFTGAIRARPGKFQLADGATIFLDEIGELPLSIQTKMLRVLQFGEVQPVGADDVRKVDVRVIAATNRDVPREVAEGRFRSDLYHRLNAFEIHVPPLRSRLEDVALLAGHFLDAARVKLGGGRMRLSPEVVERLERHDWPGNVRELEHVVTRAVLRAGQPKSGELLVIEAEHLVDALSRSAPVAEAAAVSTAPTPPPAGMSFRAAVDAYKREVVEAAFRRSGGNWSAAARELGLDRGNLQRMAQRLGLK